MAISTTFVIVSLCLTACLLLPAMAEQCVACSYNRAGDGSTDYECVNDTYRYVSTRNISCDFTERSCVVKAIYSTEAKRTINSLVRDCLPNSQISHTGCDAYTPKTCYFKCTTSKCNDMAGADKVRAAVSGTDTGDGGSASSLATSLLLTLVCGSLGFVIR